MAFELVVISITRVKSALPCSFRAKIKMGGGREEEKTRVERKMRIWREERTVQKER